MKAAPHFITSHLISVNVPNEIKEELSQLLTAFVPEVKDAEETHFRSNSLRRPSATSNIDIIAHEESSKELLDRDDFEGHHSTAGANLGIAVCKVFVGPFQCGFGMILDAASRRICYR